MNLINTYANYVGVKPEEAFIDECFYPIAYDNYIVINSTAGFPTKSYDYFDTIVEHVKLPVIQLGGKDDLKLPGAVDLRGQTSWNQTAYLIKNAKLFLGGDSMCAHIANHFGTPAIVLWGATLSSTCSTGWHADKTTHMNPVDRFGCPTACHSNVCIKAYKCINTITPESILTRIAGILGNDMVKMVEILHTGELAKLTVIEWVPVELSPKVFGTFQAFNGVVSIRCDLHPTDMGELSHFCNQTTQQRYVIISGPTDFSRFHINPAKLDQLLILIDKTNLQEGLKIIRDLSKKAYKCRLISKLDHTEFNAEKIDMMDCPPMTKLPDYTPTDAQKERFLGKELGIKTFRKVLGGDGQFFLTFRDCLTNKNSVELLQDSAIITMDEEHLKELQFLTIRKYQ